VVGAGRTDDSRLKARLEAVVVFGLAAAAAVAIKLPELFGYHLAEDGFYARNLSFFVLPLLTGYFAWKRGLNAVTGDYSRGAVGQWVEGGKIQYPVHEVTIAGNLRDLYPRIAAIGDDQDLRGGIRCGSLLVEEMTIAGN